MMCFYFLSTQKRTPTRLFFVGVHQFLGKRQQFRIGFIDKIDPTRFREFFPECFFDYLFQGNLRRRTSPTRALEYQPHILSLYFLDADISAVIQ